MPSQVHLQCRLIPSTCLFTVHCGRCAALGGGHEAVCVRQVSAAREENLRDVLQSLKALSADVDARAAAALVVRRRLERHQAAWRPDAMSAAQRARHLRAMAAFGAEVRTSCMSSFPRRSGSVALAYCGLACARRVHVQSAPRLLRHSRLPGDCSAAPSLAALH